MCPKGATSSLIPRISKAFIALEANPKPAPIPEGIDVHAAAEQQPIAIEEPISRVQQEIEQQKNASIGLISIIALIILAIIAWLLFK